MLGVSRTPVREALLNLFRDGVVEIIPKRGYRLVELDETAIMEIRLLRVLKGKGQSQEDMFGIDEAFHIRMAEMAGLYQIRRELLSVRAKMYLIASGARVASLRNDNVVKEHAAIVDALEQHDGRKARRLITQHVERSIDAFVAARADLLAQQRLERLS